ncbi:TetR family transcriptional regulator C-terminal domain-containing protein [Anaerovorax odorimutans]|uniref:TetR family transcriptional regulator C-terminal domain-containing protein n=1 Tax=Anaerovorax odorimutans TaxID=109327 RepID=A0ABT1RP92_9FIRM|nr:TetR-like C-terminal domain-containing protein [Anaerovorax odorimutans]MCQ4636984.1 TetR family transcriptional regulator C-terminal domain-containing protein [Anaerovorax odorimutans]
MAQKIDRRIKRTKALLQKSLLELMKSKPVKNITIKELVDFADINRSTFYLHYTSVYDILDELEQNLLDQLYQVFDDYPQNYDEEDSFSFISAMLQIVFDNQETCNILLNPKYNTGFIDKVQILLDQKVAERLQHILGSDFKISGYLSSFYIAGCMGMLRVWQFDENRPSPDQMARMCYGLIMNTIQQMKQASSEVLSAWDTDQETQ